MMTTLHVSDAIYCEVTEWTDSVYQLRVHSTTTYSMLSKSCYKNTYCKFISYRKFDCCWDSRSLWAKADWGV